MDKSILITGCSSGLGYDAAHGLKKRGWRVFATCRNELDCERLRKEGLESFKLDYDDSNSIKLAVEYVVNNNNGVLGALFNNGAFACPGAVEDLPRDALRAIFETNFFGYHELTKEIIPLMRAQGYGRIINCSSVLGIVPLKWRGAYNATKFALEGLTQTLRLEMRGSPVEVILLNPGPVTSKIRENSIPHFEKWINWRNSVWVEHYEATLIGRLRQKSTINKFELPASAVTEKLLLALESQNPAPSYYITKPTYFMALMRRVLPTSWLERLLATI
jgi:NAD(P)-dependent dehydrogenase (short-subunit alcohol dehydrogenase family)